MRHGLNIVAIGGGTGLSTLLRGLKTFVGSAGTWSIANLGAIVTVTDEGGSSGELRREFGMLPPGDIRNCIVALAEEEQLLSRVFNYRFEAEGPLKGHSLGNLLLTAMTDITGTFDNAILAASNILAIRGAIYPSTLSDVRLRAILEDGKELIGEVAISGSYLGDRRSKRREEHARIVHLTIDPADAQPVGGAIDAIAAADMILIGPGSLYTSVLPNLLIKDLAEALRSSKALRVYVCNVMTQPGETDGYSAEQHLAAIVEHAGLVVDVMIMNGRRPSEQILANYEKEDAFPVAFDVNAVRDLGVTPFFGDIIAEGNYVRHDSRALADTIFRLYDRYGRTLERMRRNEG